MFVACACVTGDAKLPLPAWQKLENNTFQPSLITNGSVLSPNKPRGGDVVRQSW